MVETRRQDRLDNLAEQHQLLVDQLNRDHQAQRDADRAQWEAAQAAITQAHNELVTDLRRQLEQRSPATARTRTSRSGGKKSTP